MARHLRAEAIAVVEIDRPNRQKRRHSGKSDSLDAISAARAAHSGDATGAAKTRDGNVEAIRVLRVARVSALKARTQALNQLRSLICTAPDELRARLRDLGVAELAVTAAALRPGTTPGVDAATKLAMRSLGRRVKALEVEVADLDLVLGPLVAATAPELLAHHGVGTEGHAPQPPSPACAAPHRSRPPAARPRTGTGCTAAETGKPTAPFGTSP